MKFKNNLKIRKLKWGYSHCSQERTSRPNKMGQLLYDTHSIDYNKFHWNINAIVCFSHLPTRLHNPQTCHPLPPAIYYLTLQVNPYIIFLLFNHKLVQTCFIFLTTWSSGFLSDYIVQVEGTWHRGLVIRNFRPFLELERLREGKRVRGKDCYWFRLAKHQG